MLSHELNQPLTALMLYLRAVEQALPESANERARDILRKAVHEAERASAIARRMNVFSEGVHE